MFSLAKPGPAPANTQMFSPIRTHTVAHAFTSPRVLMSQRQCHTCRGHTVSHTCPSLLSSVGWATQAPPAHQPSEQTPLLHPSQVPALLTGDAFISRRKGGRAVEGTSFQICPSHPQHSQYHTPTPQDTGHSPSHSIPGTGPCTHPASAPQCSTHRHLSRKAPKPSEHLGFPWRPPHCPKVPGIDKKT